jgi:hypothetical protein
MNISRTLGLTALLLFAASAVAVDWSKVVGKEVVLFYPGQAAWEWTLTQSDHSGNEKFRKGKDCRDCHQDEQTDMGTKIVKGEKLEPHPIPGKRASIAMTVKAAHDGDRLYLHFEWPQFSGTVDKQMDPDVATRVTLMLDDGKVVEATRAGCWGTCHADLPDMARAKEGSTLTKYLAASRTKITRDGGDENYKSAGDLEKLLKDGVFMEYWQAQLNPGAPPKAVDGYILDKRHVNENPSISAEGGLEGDNWVVVLSRPLKAPGPSHKNIVAGKTYSLGFAIHDAYSEHRYHHVSFRNTLALDSGDADLVAKKN